MSTHTCQLTSQYYEFASRFKSRGKFKTLWTKCFSINPITPKCIRHMDSMAAIANEKRRHSRMEHWWIVHPFSYGRFLWEMFMMIIYTIAFISIPFMISFVVMDYDEIRLDNVNIPIYVISWIDLFGNFITGYYDKKTQSIVLDIRRICLSYLKGFLVIDVVSSLPYDHLTLLWRRLPGQNSYYHITLINILPLTKLARYNVLNSYIRQFFDHFLIQKFYYKMFITLLLSLYIVFWFSCLCNLIPSLVMHSLDVSATDCEDCWVTRLDEEDTPSKFQHSLFIVLENMLGYGYGLFAPKTDAHILMSAVLMVIGRLMEAYIIIIFLQVKLDKKSPESKFQEIISQLSAYTRQRQLPLYMKKRLRAYYLHRFKQSYFREKVILSNLSEQLRQEVMLQSCRRLVENVTTFRNLPRNILQSIVENLKFELYLPNDVIVKAGTHGDCMFFLASGAVAVLTPTGKEICHLDDGAHFGEVALLVPDQKRVASVVAIEICEVYRLDRASFRKCIAVHSEMFAEIERMATERIERTALIEEQHKRFLLRKNVIPGQLTTKYRRKKFGKTTT